MTTTFLDVFLDAVSNASAYNKNAQTPPAAILWPDKAASGSRCPHRPVGWNPDINDGVRLNIRPFVTAGVLRRKFSIHWRKDRGKNPDGSERLNDLHFTPAQKLAGHRSYQQV